MFRGRLQNAFDMIKVITYLKTANIICFDIESTGLCFITDTLLGLSLNTDNGLNIYIPFTDNFGLFKEKLDTNDIMRQLKPYFEKDGVLILAHNLGFDMQWLWNYNIDIGWKCDKKLAADTMVMSHLLNENREYHNLKYLGRTILHLDMTEFSTLTQGSRIKFDQVYPELALDYALKDTQVPMQLYHIFLPLLEKERLLNVFWMIEMPFLKVLAKMKRRGVHVDTELMEIYEERIHFELEYLQRKLFELAGKKFNMNSGDQLGEVLFGKNGFGAPIQKMTEGGKKPKKDGTYAPPKPSTDADSIETLGKIKNAPWSEFCSVLLRFKELQKINSTYLIGIRKLLKPDGKIHCNLLQIGTVTGRLSSTEPNLQNQPAGHTWADIYYPGKTYIDRELYSTILRSQGINKFTMPSLEYIDEVKKLFPQHMVKIPKDLKELQKYVPNMEKYEEVFVVIRKIRDFYYNPYGTLVTLDYSQMEMRVMAHFSKDPGLMEAFEKGVDIHTWVARKAFKIPDDKEVPKDLRSKAKAIGFGTIFGKTVQGFAEDWFGHEKDFWTVKEIYGKKRKVPQTKYLDKAQEFLDAFFTAFGGVKAYMDQVHTFCLHYGFIKTIVGRKRRLPHIYSEATWLKNKAKRQAINSKIQGSAADIIKLAMIKAEADLEGTGGEMVLQVHDELVTTCPIEKAEMVRDIIKNAMENIVKLDVIILAEASISQRWGSAK